MLNEIRAGNKILSDGVVDAARASRIGALVTGDGQGRYYEQASRGNIFSLVLGATSAAPTAGQLNAAAAAAVTQFAIWNPAGSGKNLSLLKFGIQVISGTFGAGGVYHSFSSSAPTIATSVVSPIQCNNIGMAAASVARALTSAAGSALTGSSALAYIRSADLQFNAAVYANVAGSKSIEYVDGDIVIPPGTCWVPTWTAAGTSLLVSYSATWEEIPV